jgi:integrase
MSLFRRGDVWWYEFWFAGRRIRESSKSPSKTVAKGAEQKRKRELEAGFNNFTDQRHERVRTFSDLADEYFDAYKLRLPQSARFAEYAIDHLKQLLGSKMLVDFNEAAVIQYQNARLSEGSAPKSINEEVGFLLRILGDPGDLLRIRLRKRKMLKLKVRQTVGKAYTPAEKDRMLEEARKARSPHIYLALTLALNAGMRDAEIRNLTWEQIDFTKKFLAVGQSKTEAGEGRTIPLNSSLFEVLSEYAVWYREKFGEPRVEWYVFPFGKPSPSDPTRPVTTLKTAWNNVRTNAQVKGRWHDNRHTLITDLAESGAGDQTIMDIAGHVSKQMLKHYSHIRMEAKRHALESIVTVRPATVQSGQEGQAERSPQKSPQLGISEDFRGVDKRCKSLNLIGGRGRNRIFNQTYFQQHAGQRMTPKTMKSGCNPINRVQMERVFATSMPLDSRLQLIVRSEVIFCATSNHHYRVSPMTFSMPHPQLAVLAAISS